MKNDHALVTIEQDIPLADSREVAEQLGISHESFYTLIKKYQHEIEEDFGILRFQIGEIKGRGQPSKYTLLTEEQTYAYMSYSQNTEQARRCKRLLVKAFTEAKTRLKDQQATQPIHALTDVMRARALANLRSVPEGYFSVMGELFKHLYNLEAILNQSLDDKAMLEISIGMRWSSYARDVLGLADDIRRKYTHHCQDGRVVQAWAYPIHYMTTFDQWIWSDYFPTQFPRYQRYRVGHLVSASTYKALPREAKER